jgi:hypothetical protein
MEKAQSYYTEAAMHAQQILSKHPDVKGDPNATLTRCIEACYDCGQACRACADACLAETDRGALLQCIRLNLDCADICEATGALASRRTGSNEAILKTLIETCALACRACRDECGKHAGRHEHCEVCAEACRLCSKACEDAAKSITPSRPH